MPTTAFDIDAFVASCVAARDDDDPVEALRAVVERAVSEPARLDAAFPVPVDPADDGIMYRSDSLLVAQGLFPRGFRTGIHDHGVAAVIGVWAGYEDNHLYRRASAGIEPSGTRRVNAGEVLLLDEGAIHEVQAPKSTWTAGLHVYLGDISSRERSSWANRDTPPAVFDGEQLHARWMEAATATGVVRRL